MKHLYLIAILIVGIAFTSCSKKSNPAPMPHTIKVTVTGTADFTAVVSVIKSTQTTSTALDTKTATTGSYEYSTSLNTDDLVQLEVQTSMSNTVSYTITDNGATGLQVSGKELGSFSKVNAEYAVK